MQFACRAGKGHDCYSSDSTIFAGHDVMSAQDVTVFAVAGLTARLQSFRGSCIRLGPRFNLLFYLRKSFFLLGTAVRQENGCRKGLL